MTATLEEIHRDPAILDRAIASQESLEILHEGRVAAAMVPRPLLQTGNVAVASIPVHRGGRGLRQGVSLDDREQMWEIAGGV